MDTTNNNPLIDEELGVASSSSSSSSSSTPVKRKMRDLPRRAPTFSRLENKKNYFRGMLVLMAVFAYFDHARTRNYELSLKSGAPQNQGMARSLLEEVTTNITSAINLLNNAAAAGSNDMISVTSDAASATTNDPADPNDHRSRLLNEWNHFETYWSRESVLKDYKMTNKSLHHIPHIKLPDFIPQNFSHDDIVLATHTSLGQDKLDRLDVIRAYWQGPISLSVRIRSADEIRAIMDYVDKDSTNLTLHFLLEYANPDWFNPKWYASQYCHNELRNLAMHSPSVPDYVLAVDLDFIPIYGGYPKLKKILGDNPTLYTDLQNHTLLNIAVFEVLHVPDEWHMNSTSVVEALQKPETNDTSTNLTSHHANRTELVNALKKLDIYTRGVFSDLPKSRPELREMYFSSLARQWHYRPGHQPTDYVKYWRYNPQEDPQDALQRGATYPIKPGKQYEPYFVGYKPHLPKYWEGFRGFGHNKQSFVRECLLAGFQMRVFYDLYLTHLAHPPSRKADLWPNKAEWTQKFQPYLESKYKESNPTGWYEVP